MLSKEQGPYINGLHETEHKQSIGIGLYIMGPGRKIWSILELNGSFWPEERIAKLSIPLERRQKGESTFDNMRAALGEFCSPEDVPMLSSSLFIVGKPELTSVFVYEKNRFCTLFPMACYRDILPTPFNADEVKPMGWKSPNRMLLQPNLRSLAGQLIRVAEEKNFWEKADDGLSRPDKRIPVFGTHFSAQDLINLLSRRDSKNDIININGTNHI